VEDAIMALSRWSREAQRSEAWRDLFGWSPWSELREMQDRMNRVFGGSGAGEGPAAGVERGTSTFPPLNIFHDNECVYVVAQLPGVELKDLELSITGDTLSLKGERKPATETPEEKYHRRERAFGFFNRLVSIPDSVEADKITATLRDGILRVVLPKKPESRPRTIQVKG
jgi:HSP20 family protein